MKNWGWLPVTILAAAALILLAAHTKQRSREEEDGGVRQFTDTNAPTVIHSNQITYFHCKFSTRDIPLPDSPIAGYVITLHAAADGGSFCLRRGSEADREEAIVPDAAFWEALQEIVSRYALARHNGQHYKVSGLPPDFGIDLEIRYASGESIRASNNQDCFLPQKAMEELVALFQTKKGGI